MLDVSALTGVWERGVANRVRTAIAPIAQEPGAEWARDPRGTAMASDGTAPSIGPRFYPVTLPRFRREKVHGAQRLRWGGALVMGGRPPGINARNRANLWLFRYDVGHAY